MCFNTGMAKEDQNEDQPDIKQLGAYFARLRILANITSGEEGQKVAKERDQVYSKIINIAALDLLNAEDKETVLNHNTAVMEFTNHKLGRELQNKFVADVNFKVAELTTS